MKRFILAAMVTVSLASYVSLPGRTFAQDDNAGADSTTVAPDPLPGWSTDATNINSLVQSGGTYTQPSVGEQPQSQVTGSVPQSNDYNGQFWAPSPQYPIGTRQHWGGPVNR